MSKKVARVFSGILLLVSFSLSSHAATITSWTYNNGSSQASFNPCLVTSSSGPWVYDAGGFARATFASSATANSKIEQNFYFGANPTCNAGVESITIEALKLSGTRNLRVSFAANLGTGTVASFTEGQVKNFSQVIPNAGSNLQTSSVSNYTASFANTVTFSGNQILRIKVTLTIVGASGSGASAKFDNFVVSGFAVPEPSSMFVFGLLGSGIGVRKYRRRLKA